MRKLSKFLSQTRRPVLLGISVACWFASIATLFGQPVMLPIDEAAIINEHRVSTLEAQTRSILDELADLKTKNWMQLAALAGLVGEAGLRAGKEKKGKQE